MVCQFCLRPVRGTNLRRVCGSCRHSGRGVCLFCGLPYQGHHACALNIAKCAHCAQPIWASKLALPIHAGLAGPPREARPGLCAKCRILGYMFCQQPGCTALAKDPGKYVFCSHHHPLPEASLWRKGIVPTGGPPFVNSRSWRSWGLELECYLDRGASVPESWKPPIGWGKGTDGSIAPPYPTESAEFRSPPYFGDAGLTKMVRDIWDIRRAGWGGINRSCGTHLHISMDGCDEEDYRAIHKFARAFEDQVFELVAPSRRDNRYCRPLGCRLDMRNRYRWTNFCSLRDLGTIEVRLHQGTMSPIRVKMWACLMLRFMEVAIRLGRQRCLPKKPLFDVLGLTRRECIYWTARKNRFIRDEQRRNHQAQAATPAPRVGA